MSDDGGLVYPGNEDNYDSRTNGITRRDQLADDFAVAIYSTYTFSSMLASLLGGKESAPSEEDVKKKLMDIPEASYELADRQIAEGKKGGE